MIDFSFFCTSFIQWGRPPPSRPPMNPHCSGGAPLSRAPPRAGPARWSTSRSRLSAKLARQRMAGAESISVQGSPPSSCTSASLAPCQRAPIIGCGNGPAERWHFPASSTGRLHPQQIVSISTRVSGGTYRKSLEGTIASAFPLHPSHSLQCEHKDEPLLPRCSAREPRQGKSRPWRGRAERQPWLTHLQTPLR